MRPSSKFHECVANNRFPFWWFNDCFVYWFCGSMLWAHKSKTGVSSLRIDGQRLRQSRSMQCGSIISLFGIILITWLSLDFEFTFGQYQSNARQTLNNVYWTSLVLSLSFLFAIAETWRLFEYSIWNIYAKLQILNWISNKWPTPNEIFQTVCVAMKPSDWVDVPWTFYLRVFAWKMSSNGKCNSNWMVVT